MRRRRLNEQHWGRQQRVAELLAKGVGSLNDAERRELQEYYIGTGEWASAFFTPPMLARFVVGMGLATLDRTPVTAIDPWCGIGPFFQHLPATTQAAGIELLQREADIARLLYPEACIVRGNTWVIWQEFVGQDLVVANPPFGEARQERSPDLGLGLYSKAECLGLEVAVRLLNPGGVLSIILPDSVLANRSTQPIRDWLLEQCYLRASISLPRVTFYWQGTASKTSVLVAERKAVPAPFKTDSNGDYWIYMAVCEDIGWDSRGRPTGNDELPVILDQYRYGFDPNRGRLLAPEPVYEQISLFDF
jgi:hypothetical protein